MKNKLTLAIIALILIVGAVAVYKNQHQTNQQETTKQNTTQNDPSEGGQYLYIKEWGVRFKLPTDLQKQVIYATKINTDVSLPTPTPDKPRVSGDIAYLTTEKLASLPDSSCKLNQPNGEHGGKVLIFRSTQNNAPYDTSDVKLAGYNYVALSGNGGLCSPKSNETSELEFIRQIISAYKSMEATN